LIVFEVAPYTDPVISLVAPVRRARAVIQRRHRVVAILLANQLGRMYHNPYMHAVATGELPNTLELATDVLRFRHSGRAQMLHLVPWIYDEAADAFAENQCAGTVQNVVYRPLRIVVRENPEEMLVRPRLGQSQRL